MLIGRARELDRAQILQDLLPRIKAGRTGQELDRPLFIVATQCVEAGADLDFDALVTEIAPLDCLRQRFGRLNRMGRDIEAPAVILAASDQSAKSAKPDSIYGEALKQTWYLLGEKCKVAGKGKNARSFIDFGVEASATWLPGREVLSPYLAPRVEAPVLLPCDVALWSRTSPLPAVDPEVSLYLHGPRRGSGDAGIVWRADLDEEALEEDWIDRVGACPPSALEKLSVPIGEAKRWLRGRAHGDIPDTEAGDEDDETRIERMGRRVLRWCGMDDARTGLARANDLRPGDIIVVPSDHGGCDAWGWAPKSRKPVPDLGREANCEHRGRDILRLSHASLELGLQPGGESALAERLADMTETEIADEFSKYLVTAEDSGEFSPVGRARVLRGRDGHPLALQQRIRRREVSTEAVISGGEAITEDDDSPRATDRPVRLDCHCQGVRDRAQRFAQQIGLAPALVCDIALAGYLHDGGKAHPAFKRLLYGGAELAAIGGPPLAKSTKLPGGLRAWVGACRRAGFPKGARHEVASLAFAEGHPTFARANDPELVLWLIGTHHGHGRPFFPAVEWPQVGGDAIEVDLGNGLNKITPARSMAELTARWLDLFGRLQARYGPWGLARLETILRLADHRQSEAEQTEIEQSDAGQTMAESTVAVP